MVMQRRALYMAGGGLGLVGVLWLLLRTDAVVPTAGGPARDAVPTDVVPRIGLDRLQQRADAAPVGDRDVFDYGAPPPTPVPPPTLAPPVTEPTPDPGPTPTPLPPLTVRYMGSVDNGKGVKVALFVTDRKEVLSGQVGDTVMNRFRVMRIGFESVDVQQMGFDQVQRLPLRPN
jgi:hypothetical protein